MLSNIETDTHSLKNLLTEVQASKIDRKDLNDLKKNLTKQIE
jgi:hypothetical protein